MLKINIEQPVRTYEAVVIMSPKASEEQQKQLFKKNKTIIEGFKGELNHLDTWGSRSLANPIKKFHRGTFFHTTFTATSDCVAELERTMRINDDVLRFMHIRLDDRQALSKHVEDYKEVLAEAKKRAEEREMKFQKKQAARKPRRPART